MKYILVSEDDVTLIRQALENHQALLGVNDRLKLLNERLGKARSGDFERFIRALKNSPLCHACVVESQEASCEAHATRAHGRDLARFLAEVYPEREAKAGDRLMDHVEYVLEEARALGQGLLLVFNGTKVPVHPTSKATDIAHHWETIRERAIAKKQAENAEKSEI